jgi:hypothetical protein
MGTPVNQVKVTLEPNDHPYRNGAYACWASGEQLG